MLGRNTSADDDAILDLTVVKPRPAPLSIPQRPAAREDDVNVDDDDDWDARDLDDVLGPMPWFCPPRASSTPPSPRSPEPLPPPPKVRTLGDILVVGKSTTGGGVVLTSEQWLQIAGLPVSQEYEDGIRKREAELEAERQRVEAMKDEGLRNLYRFFAPTRPIHDFATDQRISGLSWRDAQRLTDDEWGVLWARDQLRTHFREESARDCSHPTTQEMADAAPLCQSDVYTDIAAVAWARRSPQRSFTTFLPDELAWALRCRVRPYTFRHMCELHGVYTYIRQLTAKHAPPRRALTAKQINAARQRQWYELNKDSVAARRKERREDQAVKRAIAVNNLRARQTEAAQRQLPATATFALRPC